MYSNSLESCHRTYFPTNVALNVPKEPPAMHKHVQLSCSLPHKRDLSREEREWVGGRVYGKRACHVVADICMALCLELSFMSE